MYMHSKCIISYYIYIYIYTCINICIFPIEDLLQVDI